MAIETIIVATNFSASCLTAATYAAALSKQLKIKEIILYHSYEPRETTDLPSKVYDYKALHEESMERLEELKTSITDLISEDSDIHLVANSKPLFLGITVLSEAYPTSLAVIGVSEKSKAERIFVGGHTVSMIKEAPLPVLVVPLNVNYQPVNRVIFAFNLKKVSGNAPIGSIKNFIEQLEARLLVLNVSQNEGDTFKPNLISDIYWLQNLWGNQEPEYHYIERKDVAKGIMEYTEEQQAQLIIAVPKNHTFFESLFKGSVSKTLAFNARVPILLFKERQ